MLLFIIVLGITYVLPKPQYENSDVISRLDIPTRLYNWRSQDMSQAIIQDNKDDRYKFISDIFARAYGTKYNESLLFLVLNVNNFHPPQDCFTSSGYKVSKMNNLDVGLTTKKLSTYAFLATKADQSFLVVYWTVIDRELIENWTYGEFKQMMMNVLNKDRAGLMMRLDILVENGDIQKALKLGERFIQDLEKEFPIVQKEYLFGQI